MNNLTPFKSLIFLKEVTRHPANYTEKQNKPQHVFSAIAHTGHADASSSSCVTAAATARGPRTGSAAGNRACATSGRRRRPHRRPARSQARASPEAAAAGEARERLTGVRRPSALGATARRPVTRPPGVRGRATARKPFGARPRRPPMVRPRGRRGESPELGDGDVRWSVISGAQTSVKWPRAHGGGLTDHGSPA